MKKLSIAIPTLNRCEYLAFTLDHFIPQMINLKHNVEIIVVNNNSDDETSKTVSELVAKYPFIRLFDCKDRVPIGDQFKRTIDFSEGEYVILWGDDDIPSPFLIEYLLNIIETKESKVYYFNRLSGYEDGCHIKNLEIDDKYYSGIKTVYSNPSSFINQNFLRATFITSIMFHRNVWLNGTEFDTTKHFGYEFMGIIYYGNKNNKIVYYHYPLCIQRKVAFREWGPNWPIYKLIGLPNLSKDLEKEGLFKNGLNIWRKKYNEFPMFCYTLMAAAQYKKRYKPYCKQFAEYQEGIFRKILVYAIIYLFPSWGYKVSRKLLFRLKSK